MLFSQNPFNESRISTVVRSRYYIQRGFAGRARERPHQKQSLTAKSVLV
jgi:hypothetical protein